MTDAITATEARSQLDALTADAAWRDKYLAGNLDGREQFSALTEAIANGGEDRLDAVLSGKGEVPMLEAVSEGQLTTSNMISAVEGLREAGLDDDVIRQIVNGRKVSKQERAAAQRLQAEKHGSREWREKYLSGDFAARRENLLISAILNAEVEQ